MGEWEKFYSSAIKQAKKNDQKTREKVKQQEAEAKAKKEAEEKARKEANEKALKESAKKVRENKQSNAKAKSGGKNKASGNTTLPTSNKKQGKSALDSAGKQAFEKAQSEYVVPKVIRNAAEGYINNSIPGTINKMITGKNFTDEINSQNPYNEQLHSGAAAGIGQFIGAGTAFMGQSALASPLTSKAAKAASGTKLGKAVASKIGESLTFGLAENAVDALTVGVAQNTAMAIGDRLKGDELLKNVAVNTGADLLFGSAMEGIGAGLGKVADNKRMAETIDIPPIGEEVHANTEVVKEQQNNGKFSTTPKDWMNSETKNQIFGAVEKRSGATVEQVPRLKNASGNYNPDTKHINLADSSKKEHFSTLKHEITHHMEGSDLYEDFSKFIFKGLEENGYDLTALRAAKKEQYSKHLGKEISDAYTDRELLAEFCGEYLFNSEKSIERLAREEPNIFRKVYEWIVDTISKIGASDEKKFLIDAQRKYEKVLDDIRKNPSTEQKGVEFASLDDLFNDHYAKSSIELGDPKKLKIANVDTDGVELTKQQQDYFKESVIRNAQGQLIPLYHTITPYSKGGWTQARTGNKVKDALTGTKNFDAGSERGLFLTSDYGMSQSYSGNGDFRYNKQNLSDGSAPDQGHYKFYANFKKPYIIDCKGENWNMISAPAELAGNIKKTETVFNISYDKASDSIKFSAHDSADSNKKLFEFLAKDGEEFEDAIMKQFNPDVFESIIYEMAGGDLSSVNMSDMLEEIVYDGKFDDYFAKIKKGQTKTVGFTAKMDYDWENNNIATRIMSTDTISKAIREKFGSQYDSIVFKNVRDYGDFDSGFSGGDVYVAFEPEQVKLVDNLNPTDSYDIRYDVGKQVFSRSDSLYFTSKNLYGEKGNKYIDPKLYKENYTDYQRKALVSLAKDESVFTETQKKYMKSYYGVTDEQVAATRKELEAKKSQKHKGLGADAANPNAGMTYEEASKLMATHKHGTPKSLPAKGDVSQAADSILGSDFISDDLKNMIKGDIGNFVKTSKSNKVTLDNVYDAIKKDGIDKSIGKLRSKIDSGAKITEEDIAMGMSIIEELDKQGKYDDAVDVAGDLMTMLSQAGRTLQAARIYSKMTPYGRVKTIRKTVEKLEKAYDTKISLDEKKLEQLFKEKDETKLNGLKRELMLDIWNQVPSSLMNKLDALRYTAMLSSPKTHLRNIFGNSFMAIGKSLSDAVEAGLEETIFKGKMDKMGAIRNKSMLNPLSESDRTLKKEAGDLFEKIKDDILNQDVKYFENGSMSRPLGANVFTGKNPVSKGAELARRAVSGSLEYEDELFMKLNFKSAFAQICKANGLTMQDLTAKELRAFTDYAVEQAQIATFRDSNKLADVFNKVYRMTTVKKSDSLGTKMGKTAGKIAMDATVPFKKTPANVLKQGWRYSPGGVLEGMIKCASAKDAKALMEGIDALSNGIVGTPVMLAGVYLAKQGLVNGSLGQYTDKKVKYDKMTGMQDYSVTINDKTITMDWMSPYSMPFFVGVEMGDSLIDSQLSGYELVDALAGITNPFFEMSMLQGLQTLMTSNYEENGVQTLIQNTMKSYVAQFVPAVSAQIAKTIAKTTRTTSVKGDTSSGKFVASTKAQLYSKIPGLYEKNQEDVDLWGRTDTKNSTTDYLQAGFRNIISPSNIKDMNTTEVDKEILRLYDALGEEGSSVIPNTANNNSNKLKYNDKEYEMTADEFTQYKKDVGQYRYKELQKLMATKEYKSATNTQKAAMIADVYSTANAHGKKQFLINSGKVTQTQYDFNNLTEKRQAKYDSKQVDKKTYTAYMSKLDGSPSQEEAAKAIASMNNLTSAQKQYLWSVSSNRDPWKTSYADYIS